MHRRALSAAVLCVSLVLASPAATAGSDDATRLQDVVDDYVDLRRPGAPRAARKDFSAAAFMAELEEQRALLATIESISPEALTPEQDIDRRLLLGIARADVATTEARRLWENDPTLYVPATRLGALLQDEGAGDIDKRAAALEGLLVALPARLAAGRENLKRPPLRFTEAAIFQARNLLDSMDAASPALVAAVARPVWSRGRAALVDYLEYLETELKPRSDGSFALGKPAYDTILRERWHMSADADEILERGWRGFRETEALAQEVAERISPGEHWVDVYERLKNDHPPADGIKQAYQEQMDAAQVFVLEKGILTLPAGERVTTIDTPPAMRRASPFGTFQTASPFGGGLDGRLILTPIEEGLSPEQRAERLRAHHHAWIPVIAVHEAYPGHHAQALKVNENPNLLRRVIRESIFSEGWGLFTEELMYEQGFLVGDDVRLTQLRNRLWRAARVILDSSLHTGKMSFEEAVDFMVERVRFDRYAAELEVGIYIRRPTYVLGYLIGMQEIEAIRAEWIERYGEPEPASEFYDPLLTVGAIPPALLREVLFAEE